MRYLITFAAGATLAFGAEPHESGGIVISEDEMREILLMRDVRIPMLEAEAEALRMEQRACEDDLAWCEAWRDKPLNRPAINLLAGIASGAAICAAAR